LQTAKRAFDAENDRSISRRAHPTRCIGGDRKELSDFSIARIPREQVTVFGGSALAR